jgi:hypothetical protein
LDIALLNRMLPEFPCWCRYEIHTSVSGPIDEYGGYAQVDFVVLHHKCQTFQLSIINHVPVVLTGSNMYPVKYAVIRVYQCEDHERGPQKQFLQPFCMSMEGDDFERST